MANFFPKISEKTHGKIVRKLTEIQWVKLTGICFLDGLYSNHLLLNKKNMAAGKRS